MKAGDIYSYKGNEYRIESFTEMKHPDTGAWLEAVLYRRRGGTVVHRSFVRAKADFAAKFQLVSSAGP